MQHSSFRVLLLGDSTSDEMQSVTAFVSQHAAGEQLRSVRDVSQIADHADGNTWFPDLIVVCQTWPDQFSPRDVHDLLTQFPLARLVVCYGPWCDSDGRTRNGWPPATRVPAEWAVRRIEAELTLLKSDVPAQRPLPLTAGRDEVFQADCTGSLVRPKTTTCIAVLSSDRAWRQMFQQVLSKVGYDVVENIGRAETLVWDADSWNNDRVTELRDLRAVYPATKCMAFTGFPRPHVTEELLGTGVDTVGFKLAPLTSTLDQLAVLCGT